MFYIFDLGAHELHGPFMSRARATLYAFNRGIRAYQLFTDTQAQNICDPGSIRLVPHDQR